MTDLQRTIDWYSAIVLHNIRLGRTSDWAREDAIALFRAAAMRLPAEQ